MEITIQAFRHVLKGAKMIRFILLFLYMLNTTAIFGSEQITMQINSNSNTSEFPNSNNVRFEGIASDQKTYKGSVACFKNWNHGNIHILKSPSHVGAGTEIDYDLCNEILQGLRDNTMTIDLWWDKASFDDFISGPLFYQIH